jgi:hypothetical protein
VYIYYQSYEAREQISKRSRQGRPKGIIQRISRPHGGRKRRRDHTDAFDRGRADAVGSLWFSV